MNTPIFTQMLSEGFWAGNVATPMERATASIQAMFDKLISIGGPW